MPEARRALIKIPRAHPAEATDEATGQPKTAEASEVASDLIQFSFRAPRNLRKRANRASAELEIPVQRLVATALDQYLKARGF